MLHLNHLIYCSKITVENRRCSPQGMRLSREEEQSVAEILIPYQENEQIQSLKKYIHHGNITTYEHCGHVTKVCCWMNRRLHLHADEQVLIVAAFLHDFYLYDWHEKDASHRLHGFFHPDVACRNAVETFQIGPEEQRVIRTHMWPLTLRRIPASREAWIVSLADKYCSVVEILEGMLQRKR